MPLKHRLKNLIVAFFRWVLSLGLLIYLFFRIDTAKTVEVLRDADLGYVFYALLTFLIIHVFLLVRWGVFIRALGLQAPVLQLVRYFFIGLFGNLFLPSAIGGDVIKVLGLCKSSSQKPKVVASVLLDRLSGFAGMTLVALLAFPFSYRLLQDTALLGMTVLMAGIFVLLGAVLFTEKLYEFFCRLFSFFPKIKSGLMKVHYDAALLKDRRYAIYQGIGISALSQVVLSFTFYLVAKALNQEVDLIYFLIFVPMICVAASMPSIGGLGVREAGAAYLFAKIGMEPGVAVSISLINFLFMVFTGLSGAVFFVFTREPGKKGSAAEKPAPAGI